MKSLEELKQNLTNNKSEDLLFLNKYLLENTKTENDFFKKCEICKYMKTLCDGDKKLTEKYKNVFSFVDVEFFKYIFSRIKAKNSKKQWDLILDYVDKAFWYFDLPKNEISFDDIQDYFLYAMLTEKTNLTFLIGIESWVYSEKANALKNKANYFEAIECLKHSIKCSPMSFQYYNAILSCFIKIKDYNNLLKYLNESYKVIKKQEHLAIYYYYYALYFYYTKKYSLAKCCAVYSTKFNVSFIHKNKLVEIVEDINNNEKIKTPHFKVEPDTLLKKANIPTWYSKEIMLCSLALFQKCLSKENKDKKLTNQVKKLLVSFNLNDYIKEYETNMLTDQNMYHFDNLKFSLKLSKSWKVIYKSAEPNAQELTILHAIKNDDSLTVYVDKKIEKDKFTIYCEYNIQKLIQSGFSIVNQKKFTTLSGYNVNLSLLKITKNYYVYTAFFMLENNNFCNITMTMNSFTEQNEKEMFKILSSLNAFYSINPQDN